MHGRGVLPPSSVATRLRLFDPRLGELTVVHTRVQSSPASGIRLSTIGAPIRSRASARERSLTKLSGRFVRPTDRYA